MLVHRISIPSTGDTDGDAEDALAPALLPAAASLELRAENVGSSIGAVTSLDGGADEAFASRDRWSVSRRASRLLAPKTSLPESFALFDMAATVSALPMPLLVCSSALFSAAVADVAALPLGPTSRGVALEPESS